MLTDDDKNWIIEMMQTLLEAYGHKKQPSKAALRTRRYREKQAASQNVTPPSQSVTAQGAKRHKTSQAVTKRHNGQPAPTHTTWTAYAEAYQQRYGVEPVRNGAVNGVLAQFVGRIGAAEAPLVAAFYLTHNGRYYVQEMHSVAAMLRNAEKLRTEWATRRTMTETEARQSDRTQTNANVWGKLIAEAEANEGDKNTH